MTCPECGLPQPGPHRGTCSRSAMHGGDLSDAERDLTDKEHARRDVMRELQGSTWDVDISRMGPLIDQAHSCLTKLAYALGATQHGAQAHQQTVHESMRDLTHTLAHMKEILADG